MIDEEEFMDIRALHRHGLTYAEIGRGQPVAGTRECCSGPARRRGRDARAHAGDALAAAHRIRGGRHAAGDRLWEARTIRHIGVVDRNDGRLSDALQRFGECEQIFDELRDERGRAVTLRNRGDTFRLRADFDAAERDLDAALEIFRRIGDRRWEARTKLSLGDMHRRQERWSTAQTLIFSARDFYAEIGNEPGEGRALRAEGLLKRDSGEADGAVSAFEKSCAIFECLGDDLWVARALMGQASAAGEEA